MLRVTVIGKRTHEVEEEITNGLLSLSEAIDKEFSLIVSGEALIRALKPELKEKLLRLAEGCNVVLACRVSPQQKADIVKLIRDFKPNVRTLSIGDGANDVNMITAAHVGIGIAGLEGKQAVRASDYSVAQFSYLRRLMFVHGRECYRRNANLVCFNFYKNVVLIMPLFFFGTISVFSAQIFYNTWVMVFFNLLYAALPIGFYAVFDRELEFDELLNNPKYYQLGLSGKLFKTSVFWLWIFEAIVQSMFVLFCCTYGLGAVSGFSDGKMSGLGVVSIMVFGVVVVLVNLKVYLLSFSHYWFTLLAMVVSALLYYLVATFFFEVLPVNESLQNFDGYGGITQIFANPNSYLLMIVLVFGSFYIQPIIEAILETRELTKEKKLFSSEHELNRSTKNEFSYLEKQDKIRAKKSIVNYSVKRNFYLDTGFAFSGEPGHALPITDPFFYERQVTINLEPVD